MDELRILEKRIDNTKHFTHATIDKYMEEVYSLKRRNIENMKIFNILSHIENYLKYKNEKLNSVKRSILSLIGTIFLPLGFIAGFFGMNFASMGNPGINKGVLAIKHSEKFVFGLAILISIVVILIYGIYFGVSF